MERLAKSNVHVEPPPFERGPAPHDPRMFLSFIEKKAIQGKDGLRRVSAHESVFIFQVNRWQWSRDKISIEYLIDVEYIDGGMMGANYGSRWTIARRYDELHALQRAVEDFFQQNCIETKVRLPAIQRQKIRSIVEEKDIPSHMTVIQEYLDKLLQFDYILPPLVRDFLEFEENKTKGV